MDEFENEDDEIEEPRKGSGKIKLILWIMFFTLSILIGLALGFFLGIVALVNVAEDLTENMTLVIDFDEEVAVDYMVKFMQEEYGDLINAAALGKDLDVNMTDDEKISVLVEGFDLEQFDDVIGIDDETKRLLEEAKAHPEQKPGGQTQQNFIPAELIEELN